MQRRGFVKLCAAAVAGISATPEVLAQGKQLYHPYGRVALIDPKTDRAVRASSLEVGETYLFHYPFVSTPCFLIDLGKQVRSRKGLRTRDGLAYAWKGGVGPGSSVVAFSAICAHRMTHPAPSVSFISYRHGETRFRNSDDKVEERRGVIYCCSENSVYDPAEGGQVLGGPAPQPLAAIELEYDREADAFFATATIGGEMFEQYFGKFFDRLVLQHGRTDVDSEVGDTCELVRLADYTSNTVNCQA